MRKTMVPLLLLLLELLLLLLPGCPAVSHRISETDVKDVILWKNGPDSKQITLNREEIALFLEFYNGAKYRGKGDGSGGTAEWGAVIIRQDGMEIRIHEFWNSDFEVSCNPLGWWFYLDSGELAEFMETRLEA